MTEIFSAGANKTVFILSRYHSYLNSASAILSAYKGNEPFASHLKKYFSQYKKFGSKDRKLISHLCYCYFRLGKALAEMKTAEKILAALFLCSPESNEILKELNPAWNEETSLPLKNKLALLDFSIDINNIFTWQDELSVEIERESFILSHLHQPDLFLRLRPGKEKVTENKLLAAGIKIQLFSNGCISIPNTSNVAELVELNKDAVVQDYNSQRVGDFFKLIKQSYFGENPLRTWDCCAASGGKSILAKDILGDIQLSVSDIRESILINLKKRFEVAGIKNYKSSVADLSKPLTNKKFETYDLIIADVPCTGSGTWSRTPEQLSYFDSEKIEKYPILQKKIVSNAITRLKPGGHLLYITCSVFKKENENVLDFIKDKFQLQLVKMELLKGYDKKADTMFAALLRRPL